MRVSAAIFVALLLVSVLSPVQAQDGAFSPSSSSSSSSTPTVSLPAEIKLPRAGTIFLLDTRAGKPRLLQLHAAEVVSNSHAAGNFARSMVYAGARASFELKGLSAPTNVEARQPGILVHLTGDNPEWLRNRVHLIRLQQTKGRRVVANSSQSMFGGQRAKRFDDVAVTKADVQPDVWLKLTPEEPLTPGEYCVVFLPKDTNSWPDTVYDFDVAEDGAKSERAFLAKP